MTFPTTSLTLVTSVLFDHGNETTEKPKMSDNENDSNLFGEQPQTNLIENEISVRNVDLISESQLQKNSEGMFAYNQCESKEGNAKWAKLSSRI